MNYNHPLKNGSTITIRVMCAIVFVVFSFCWLFFFQSDLLTVTQHILSNGLTTYRPVLGAIIITALLQILQFIVYALSGIKKRAHALTYVPSMLALALLTDISIGIEGRDIHDWAWYYPVIILLLWIPLAWILHLVQELENDTDYSIFSRPIWINMLLMSLQFMCVAWIGSTNAVFQYRMSTEVRLAEGNYKKALEVGRRSLESDPSLLMLRMYGLARENALGERLFEYPISGNSSQILPNDSTDMVYCPVDSLWRFLGGRPAKGMEPMRYLELLASRDSIAPRQVADYRLCGLLIDRDLDRFARELRRYYPLDEHLPRHYREALILYAHSRSNPLYVYHHAVTEEDWRNLQELESHYTNFSERHINVENQYRGTYWYYYEYVK